MQRTIVQIAKMDLADVRVGDVVNKDPEGSDGWFVIEELRRLPSGDINATDASRRASIMGADYDIVGVQVRKTVEIDMGSRPSESPSAI